MVTHVADTPGGVALFARGGHLLAWQSMPVNVCYASMITFASICQYFIDGWVVGIGRNGVENENKRADPISISSQSQASTRTKVHDMVPADRTVVDDDV